MHITKERYEELINGIVGFQVLKDIINDDTMTDEEKLYEMRIYLEVKEEMKK